MKMAKKFTAIAAICASLISMAACGGSSSDSSSSLRYPNIVLGKTGVDIKTTIKVFSNRSDMSLKTYPGTNWSEYVSAFNKVYPNIKVNIQTDSNYEKDAMTRLQGNSWGDVMLIPNAVDSSDLSTYFIPYDDTSEMDKVIKYAYSKEYDNQVYGVSNNGTAVGVVYNKAVFAEAGISQLPKTPDEFIADLKSIKEKTDAIPLYTNYAAGFTMGAWDQYIGGTATGDAKYMKQELPHMKDPFSDTKDGTHPYSVYKILYDAVADGLTEKDYSTTDWEGSKGQINNGKIATMVLGSWAVSQMKAAGEHPNDVQYMPFPISVKGEQYTSSAPDYSYGINKKVSKANQEASMIFVKWLTEKSNFAYNEGGIGVKKNDNRLPDVYSQFKNVKFIIDQPALKGEEDLFNDLNSDSELAINSNGDSRVEKIVEAAANKGESFDSIMDGWNKKWNSALKTENVDIKFTTKVK